MMGLEGFIDQPLARLPLAQICSRSWPFDLIAPLATWYWVSAACREPAQRSLGELQCYGFDALGGCHSLEDVARHVDGRILGNAYHRALIEAAAARGPEWRLRCNELGHLWIEGGGSVRAQGQQFGMLAVFPDRTALHSDLGLALPPHLLAGEHPRTLKERAPSRARTPRLR